MRQLECQAGKGRDRKKSWREGRNICCEFKRAHAYLFSSCAYIYCVRICKTPPWRFLYICMSMYVHTHTFLLTPIGACVFPMRMRAYILSFPSSSLFFVSPSASLCTHMHISCNTYIHIYIRLSTCAYIVYTYAKPKGDHTSECLCIYIHIPMHIYLYIYIYIHICIHTHIHTYTHLCLPTPVRACAHFSCASLHVPMCFHVHSLPFFSFSCPLAYARACANSPFLASKHRPFCSLFSFL